MPLESYLEHGLRLICAAILGAVVGADRQRHGKPAGLRTNMLVALGAAGFTLTAYELVGNEAGADPARIITGIATGIGFLGAGSILRQGKEVEGVTTAAAVWVVGAIGSACGVGAYAIAVELTVLSFLVLTALGRFENGDRS
jgi:putative Mg2+ transporter-C (MgtC) family protein